MLNFFNRIAKSKVKERNPHLIHFATLIEHVNVIGQKHSPVGILTAK